MVMNVRLNEILAEFAVDRDVRRAAHALATATEQSASQYTRVWSLD
jgi:hypothetical protein